MSNRRSFLKQLAAMTAGLAVAEHGLGKALQPARDRVGELLPQRLLGKTGEQVTMLGIGGSHVGREEEKNAQAIIETALEGGVRFFDNAESYQSGRAERYYGKFLVPKYRDVAFIMTKSTATTAQLMREHLEGSLQRMNCDYIDLWQIHSLRSPEDVDARIQNDVLKVVMEAQKSGKVRYVGFTGHADFKAHLRMLDLTNSLQTCQMPINCFDPNYKSFIRNVLPRLVDEKVGVIAMKTLSNGGFFGGTRHFHHGEEPRIIPNVLSIQEAIHFVWSLPVSVLVTGASSPEMLKEKIDLAKSFRKMEESQRLALIEKVAGFDGSKVEFYKS